MSEKEIRRAIHFLTVEHTATAVQLKRKETQTEERQQQTGQIKANPNA